MRMQCISLTHKNCPLSLREKISLSHHDVSAICETLKKSGAEESLCLSTCNRTEIYTISPKDTECCALEILAHVKNVDLSEITNTAELFNDSKVAEHLFSLACGLRSLVLGETEILGQLKKAYADALAIGSCGKILNRSFQNAFNIAKQVRSGTEIGKFRVSIASIAVDEIYRLHPDLIDKTIAVWGTGEVGRAVVRSLYELGVNHGIILSRIPDKAWGLAEGWRGVDSHNVEYVIADSDIFISCTGAAHPVILPEHVADRTKPLLLVDLAVPRDVSHDIQSTDQTKVIDMDDIGKISQQSIEARKNAKDSLLPLLRTEAKKFWKCIETSRDEKCIADWRMDAHKFLESEIESLKAEWPQMPPELSEKFDQLGRRLMHRMLHWPSVALKHAINENLPCAKLFAEISDIDE